ncbi:hypothetical protein [Granulicella sp. S156]|uniref:hypothetical protein n=1 Tax=Granulicella sp. S156 TaxID=1747224 RepID=UPI00131D12E0|nr:hypothetical protein [Granulicella sp. S156]
MSRWKRIGLFSLIALATGVVVALFVDDGHIDRDLLLLTLGSLLVILPCWLLLLPFVAVSDNLRAWRPVVFVLAGGLIATIVALGEAHHFYLHSSPNKAPTAAWFHRTAWESALLGAAACAVYLGILKATSRPPQDNRI